ncbi:MAG: hypothetical protein ACRC7N_18805 [Clostridium sp.]
MLDKISLSDKECEYLAKGIAIGAGCGVVIGAVMDAVPLVFSIGGVVGIIGSLIYCAYDKHKKKVIV